MLVYDIWDADSRQLIAGRYPRGQALIKLGNEGLSAAKSIDLLDRAGDENDLALTAYGFTVMAHETT